MGAQPPATHQSLVGESRGVSTITSLCAFTTYARVVDELIEKADKDQLADIAQRLALSIGYYHEKYGDVPREELLRLVRAEDLDEKTHKLLRHGMQNLASALAGVMGVP